MVRTHYSRELEKERRETEYDIPPSLYLPSSRMDATRQFFRSRGRFPTVDDQIILSGILSIPASLAFIWKNTPKEYGLSQTLYTRFIKWSGMGIFEKIFTSLSENAQDRSPSIGATHLKVHRTAASMRRKGLLPFCMEQKRD